MSSQVAGLFGDDPPNTLARNGELLASSLIAAVMGRTVDTNPTILETAKRRTHSAGHANVTFLAGDVREVPLDDDFDGADRALGHPQRPRDRSLRPALLLQSPRPQPPPLPPIGRSSRCPACRHADRCRTHRARFLGDAQGDRRWCRGRQHSHRCGGGRRGRGLRARS
jgi:hypothetical protein